MLILAALLAFLIAFGISLAELVTADYPRTFFVLTPRQSPALYVYGAIYGAIAFGIVLGLDALSDAGLVSLNGTGLHNMWIRAIVVGLTVKAFLHIRLFSLNTGGPQSFPVGIETVTQLFEPWLLKTIFYDEFDGVRKCVKEPAKKYTDLEQVRRLVEENLPDNLDQKDRDAFISDVRQASTIQSVMMRYLSFVGKKTFKGTFEQ